LVILFNGIFLVF